MSTVIRAIWMKTNAIKSVLILIEPAEERWFDQANYWTEINKDSSLCLLLFKEIPHNYVYEIAAFFKIKSTFLIGQLISRLPFFTDHLWQANKSCSNKHKPEFVTRAGISSRDMPIHDWWPFTLFLF